MKENIIDCNGNNNIQLPNILQQKLVGHKVECRLTPNKECKIGKLASITVKNVPSNQRIKAAIQIVTSDLGKINKQYSDIDCAVIPIPRYSKLQCDIYKISVTEAAPNNKTKTISFKPLVEIKLNCCNLNDYCYPLVFSETKGWYIPSDYELIVTGIKLNQEEWSLITVVSEYENDLISILSHGGIFYSKLNKNFFLRVPKGNFKEDQICKYQVVTLCKSEIDQKFSCIYQKQLNILTQYSEMLILNLVNANRCSIDNSNILRRSVTVKLPVPDWVMQILIDNNIDVIKGTDTNLNEKKLGLFFVQKFNDTWSLVESSLQFSNSLVTFETKYFGVFMFVTCKENQERHLFSSVSLLENLFISHRQIILSFLYSKANNMYLWHELVSIDEVENVKNRMKQEDFIFIPQNYKSIETEPKRGNRRYSKSLQSEEILQRKTFEIAENSRLSIVITGDVDRIEMYNRKSHRNDQERCKSEELAAAPVDFNNIDNIGKSKNTNEVDVLDVNDERFIDFDLMFLSNLPASKSVVIHLVPAFKQDFNWDREILKKFNTKHLSSSIKHNDVIHMPETTIKSDIDPALLINQELPDTIQLQCNSDEKRWNFLLEFSVDYQFTSVQMFNQLPLQTTAIYLAPEILKEYFSLMTESEKEAVQLQKEEAERLKQQNLLDEQNARNANVTIQANNNSNSNQSAKSISYSRIVGLSRPRVINKRIEREPKVISRRSITVLCSIIKQGLTLGVYLGLPDNVIAGIGFDSLSQLSLNNQNNVTYKVFLAWKKMISYNKTQEPVYIDQLSGAIASLGYDNISQLINHCWRNNLELTHDDCQRALFNIDFKLPN